MIRISPEDTQTLPDQRGWRPNPKDLQAARFKIIQMMLRALELMKTEVPQVEIERVLVDIPVAERGQIAISHAQALRWKETQLRPPQEIKELEEMISTARSMGMGFGQGTAESEGGTRLLCILLKDASIDIRRKAANAMLDWAEPLALPHLEGVWNGKANQEHLLRLENPLILMVLQPESQ